MIDHSTLRQQLREAFQNGSKSRPPECGDDVLEYLDSLRAEGDTNMAMADPWLMAEFGFTRLQALACLAYWQHTFAARHPNQEV